MPPSPFCQLIRWFIAIYKKEKALKATQIWCNMHARTHTQRNPPQMHVFFITMTDSAHKCQGRHSLSLLFDECAFNAVQRLRVRVQTVRVCVYFFFFLLLLFWDYAYVFPVSITVLVSTRASSYLPRAFTQGISISLHVCCRDGTHPQPGEEMRKGINEGERGHRCQRRRWRRRMRVWILSCREHMGVALCRRRRDKESRRWEAMQAVVKSREGVAGLSWSMAK